MDGLRTWQTAILSAGSGLSSESRFVALALSLHVNEADRTISYPDVPAQVAETDLGPEQVVDALHTLEEEGWLQVEHPDSDLDRAGHFRLLIPRRVLVEGWGT